MNRGKSLFAQITEHLPLTTFRRCVGRYGGELGSIASDRIALGLNKAGKIFDLLMTMPIQPASDPV
jgi:hypothetical protein